MCNDRQFRELPLNSNAADGIKVYRQRPNAVRLAMSVRGAVAMNMCDYVMGRDVDPEAWMNEPVPEERIDDTDEHTEA